MCFDKKFYLRAEQILQGPIFEFHKEHFSAMLEGLLMPYILEYKDVSLGPIGSLKWTKKRIPNLWLSHVVSKVVCANAQSIQLKDVCEQ